MRLSGPFFSEGLRVRRSEKYLDAHAAGTELRVAWDKPSDCEPSVVNGEEAYWLRCIVTAFGGPPSSTTAPLGTRGWLFLEKTAKASYEHIIE
jgi:hypothetical protein